MTEKCQRKCLELSYAWHLKRIKKEGERCIKGWTSPFCTRGPKGKEVGHRCLANYLVKKSSGREVRLTSSRKINGPRKGSVGRTRGIAAVVKKSDPQDREN